MKRRRLLACTGLGVSTVVAGCLGEIPDDGDPGASDFAGPNLSDAPEAYPVYTGGFDNVTYQPTGTHERIGVGTPPGEDARYEPHRVTVWSPDEKLEITVRIIDGMADSELLGETFEIPEGATVDVVLFDPSAYIVEVRCSAIDEQLVLQVPCRRSFDCNRSVTYVGVYQDGEIGSSFVKQNGGCQPVGCSHDSE